MNTVERVESLNYEHRLIGRRCPLCGQLARAGQSVRIVPPTKRPGGELVVHEACATKGSDAAG